jgi:hypothetical protein
MPPLQIKLHYFFGFLCIKEKQKELKRQKHEKEKYCANLKEREDSH